MRIDVSTDTYEPDVNGVALTLEQPTGGFGRGVTRIISVPGDGHAVSLPPHVS